MRTPAITTLPINSQARFSREEGLFLLSRTDPNDVESIRLIANQMRKEKVGDRVPFTSTLYLYPTNLCELRCPLCSFYAKPTDKHAFFFTPEELEEKVKSYLPKGITEVHIVGGIWRECNLDYYSELFSRIKKISPKLHIKALTPVEYDFLAKGSGLSIKEVLMRLITHGLGSLPGGGAEILVERVRKVIAPKKISSDDYLAIHQTAHELGLKSNVTMLFDQIEENEDIIDHLLRVRDLQDKTGGIRAFVPLKFGEEKNALGKRKERLKKKNLTLIYAVSRLMLDNIPHIKVLWNYIGIEEGLHMLESGGSDFASTNLEEQVIVSAGGEKKAMDVDTMRTLIQSIGRIPFLTHSGNV